MTDEEFNVLIEIIDTGIPKFNADEQNIITAWIEKLSNVANLEEEIIARNDHVKALAKMITETEVLEPPFTEMPPYGGLKPLKGAPQPGPSENPEPSETPEPPENPEPSETPEPPEKPELPENPEVSHPSKPSKSSKPSESFPFPITKMPCNTGQDFGVRMGVIPKSKPSSKRHRPVIYGSNENEFEDPEEMARVIANSKGQPLAEFIFAISRHTSDYGAELRAAMKTEVSSFKEYVDHVLSQRIKDLTEVLDEEQNAELQKIKKDIEKWQLELCHCKKRIKELFSDFNLDSYKKDKTYLKKTFNSDVITRPREDSFKQWKEENCHRLKWYSEMTCKIMRSNEQISQEITNVKSQALELEAREAIKQQSHVQLINCELNDLKRLKLERDRLQKENADLQARLQ